MVNHKKDFINQLEETIDDNIEKKTTQQTNKSTNSGIDKNISSSTDVISGGKIKIKKRIPDKTNKKNFNIYMDNDIVTALDKFAKKSGYSRNELIGMACKYFVENSELEE